MDRRKQQRPGDFSTVAGRVAWALRNVWQGSQSRMAQDIGVSQSAISIVVSGKRNPGKRFLAQVASYPMVNANWLFNGLGEPLVVEEQRGHGGRYFSPVAAEPLPGTPRSCRGKLTGQYRPVAAPDFDEHGYWLMVASDEFNDKGVFENDWLLMTADRSWLDRPASIVGQPCVVLVGGHKNPTFAIRWLAYDAGAKPTGKYVIDMLAVADDEPKMRDDGRYHKNIRLPGTTRSTETPANRLALKDVVAIAVKLERPWT